MYCLFFLQCCIGLCYEIHTANWVSQNIQHNNIILYSIAFQQYIFGEIRDIVCPDVSPYNQLGRDVECFLYHWDNQFVRLSQINPIIESHLNFSQKINHNCQSKVYILAVWQIICRYHSLFHFSQTNKLLYWRCYKI